MEPSAIILILVPILFPIAVQLGIDPIHLGIIMVVNMEIGMVTPPVGLNLFVASGITGMPLLTVVRAALPWLMILLSFLMLDHLCAGDLAVPAQPDVRRQRQLTKGKRLSPDRRSGGASLPSIAMVGNAGGGLVRAVGVEPTLCYQNQILSLARLPIPPRPQGWRTHRVRCAERP